MPSGGSSSSDDSWSPKEDPLTQAGTQAAAGGSSDWASMLPQSVLTERDIASIVGGMWDETSRGDQAYFFPRAAGAAVFTNGSIVALVDGQLSSVPMGGQNGEGVMYLVVSDKNAKWKGEPLPSPEEETLGHWCAFLGQVIPNMVTRSHH